MFTHPKLEPRLQRRYEQLVSEELGPKHAIAAGLHALPGARTAMASTQAAWRFYANERVTASSLVEPLIASARTSVAELEPRWGLVVHDWSQLNYAAHTRKADRVALGPGRAFGYHLQTWLLISDADGAPLAPIGQSLWAEDGIRTTRCDEVLADRPHIDEITDAIRSVEELGLGRPLVHIVDRGGDSVGHFRAWIEDARQFVVRADAAPRVRVEGEQVGLGQLASRLQLRSAQAVDLSGGVIGQQFVAEARVRITRPARPHRRSGGVTHPRETVAGPAVELRLVVSEIRTPDERVVARWLLLTNVGDEVGAEQIARWYYWRWRIESYFKLIKSAGHELEAWQQESADAVFKRLLVVSMACVVVWHLARSAAPQADAARALLIRLSGRQMRRDRPVTEPALLAGLMVLLPMLDVLDHYTLDDIRRLARVALPGFSRFSEGDV